MLMLSLLPLAAGVSAEPACLLQKPKAPTQLSLLAQPPVAGWEYAGKGDCALLLQPYPPMNPTACASQCTTEHPSAIAFSYDGWGCYCCEGLQLDPGFPRLAYARAAPLWQFLGAGKSCSAPALTTNPSSLNECAASCGSGGYEWLIYRGTDPSRCDCCTTEYLDSGTPDEFVYGKVPGWVYAGLGTCDPTTISTPQPPPSGPNECANHCSTQAATGFSFNVGTQACDCCYGVRVETNPNPTLTPYVYALADPFWRFFAAYQKCVNPVFPSYYTTLAECAKFCESPPNTGKWLVYGYNGEQDRCDCCDDAGLVAVPSGGNGGLLSLSESGGLGYRLDPLTLPEVTGWRFDGRRMDCAGAPVDSFTLGGSPPSACGAFCQQKFAGWIVIDQNFPTSTAATCKCCLTIQPEGDPGSGAYSYFRLPSDNGGGVYGDPHITALDGSHYLLLNQGTFSLWHLHGLLTEFQTQDGFKKVPVEWEIFTHYSGHQSFTKGLVLVDRSAGVQRQVLEITSQDCQWRARSGAEWTMVNKPGMISVGQDYVTGFNVTKTNGRKHRGHASRNQLKLNQVHLSMNSKDGATDIAVLTVSCRPKRNLNLNLVMKRRSDHGFVEGELAGGKKLAALETDSEFNIKGKWQDVGGWLSVLLGSDQAAAYLRQMDEDSSLHVSLLQTCTAEDKVQAKITCSNYLDSLEHLDPAGFFLNDCVYDVCHGAGEVAAELAAELLTSASV